MLAKFRRIALAAILALSTLGALGAAPTSATYACATANNLHAFVDTARVSLMAEALADVVYLRALDPCSDAYNNGQSYVLPANIGDDAGAHLVQFGYGATGQNRILRFLYTPNDMSSPPGVLATPPYFPSPIIGHNYTFRISAVTDVNGFPIWLYRLTDWSIEPPPTYSVTTARSTWVTPRYMWSGFEAYNDLDTLGSYTYSTQINNIRYRDTYLGTTYWERQTDVAFCCGTAHDTARWHPGIYLDSLGHTVLWAYTEP